MRHHRRFPDRRRISSVICKGEAQLSRYLIHSAALVARMLRHFRRLARVEQLTAVLPQRIGDPRNRFLVCRAVLVRAEAHDRQCVFAVRERIRDVHPVVHLVERIVRVLPPRHQPITDKERVIGIRRHREQIPLAGGLCNRLARQYIRVDLLHKGRKPNEFCVLQFHRKHIVNSFLCFLWQTEDGSSRAESSCTGSIPFL